MLDLSMPEGKHTVLIHRIAKYYEVLAMAKKGLTYLERCGIIAILVKLTYVILGTNSALKLLRGEDSNSEMRLF